MDVTEIRDSLKFRAKQGRLPTISAVSGIPQKRLRTFMNTGEIHEGDLFTVRNLAIGL